MQAVLDADDAVGVRAACGDRASRRGRRGSRRGRARRMQGHDGLAVLGVEGGRRLVGEDQRRASRRARARWRRAAARRRSCCAGRTCSRCARPTASSAASALRLAVARRAGRARRAPGARSRAPSASGTGCRTGTRSRCGGGADWRAPRRLSAGGRLAGDASVPVVGDRMQPRIDSSVVLPEPDGPISRVSSPASSVRLTPFSARTMPAPWPSSLTISVASRMAAAGSSGEHHGRIDARHFHDRGEGRDRAHDDGQRRGGRRRGPAS